MMTTLPALVSQRLVIEPLAGRPLRAWMRGDRSALRTGLGLVFPDVEDDPPMVGADLPEVRAAMRSEDDRDWWIWIAAVRDVGVAVGTLGIECGEPTDDRIRIAHWTYPQWEGRRFAREAADTIAGWILAGSELAATPVPTIRYEDRGRVSLPTQAEERDHRNGEVFVYQPRARARG